MNKLGPSSNVTVHKSVRSRKAVSQPEGYTAQMVVVGEAMWFLTCRDDGWLRVCPQDHGAVVFYKWKFTSGVHDGHYVMFRDDSYNISAALLGLVNKIQRVMDGLDLPVKDRYYSPE